MTIERYFNIKRTVTPDTPGYNGYMEECRDFNRHLTARYPFLAASVIGEEEYTVTTLDYLPATIQNTFTDENFEERIHTFFGKRVDGARRES